MTGLKANEVEEGLLAVICDAMLKPENFAADLKKNFKDTRSAISGLWRDTVPVGQASSGWEQGVRSLR